MQERVQKYHSTEIFLNSLSFHFAFGGRQDLASRFVLPRERLICPPLVPVADGVGGLNKADQMLVVSSEVKPYFLHLVVKLNN